MRAGTGLGGGSGCPRSQAWLRVFAGVGLAAAAGGSLFSAVYWLVNLNHAVSGGLPLLDPFLHRSLSDGWRAFFEGLSKDASTMTPLIALLLSASILYGSVLVLFRPERLPRVLAGGREHFPFRTGYQTTLVQLGLIGTLWSFLLIGNRLDPSIGDPSESVTLLVTAFGTALLSTFSGVVGAFILGPLVATAFRARLSAAGIREESTPGILDQLRQGLRDLSVRAGEASSSLQAESGEKGNGAEARPLMDSVRGLSEALEKLRDRVQAFEAEEPVGRVVDTLVERIAEMQERQLERLEKASEARHGKTAETLADALEQASRGIETGQAALGRELKAGLAELGTNLGTQLGVRLGAQLGAHLGERWEEQRAEDREALLGKLTAVEGGIERGHRQLEKVIEERSSEAIRIASESREPRALLDKVDGVGRELRTEMRNLATVLRKGATSTAPATRTAPEGSQRGRWGASLLDRLPWRTR